jgi:peptide/nickel transport system substrate-binding protein
MKIRLLQIFILLTLILPACAPKAAATVVISETQTPPPPPSPSPTPGPRSLKICLGGEPNTLYPYGNPNAAARSVLSAVYDGPIDTVKYGYSPVILEKIPNIKDGDAQISPVDVKAGDQVVDANGDLVSLTAGTQVRPSSCRADSCAVTYDGTSALKMDQLVVTFTMLDKLMWSDGKPLTASDSVYSFQLASANATPTSKFIIDRTQTYEAASDGVTVQWWGRPGFIDPEYSTNFWMPLPEHAWSQFKPEDLLTVDVSARAPLGWGPYILKDWKVGESIELVKNLNYFRADANLPKFDDLTFLFYNDPNTAITALVDGKCDVLDPSINLDGQVDLLQQMQKAGQAKLYTAQTSTMEWLGIGIAPASYDNGFNLSDKQDRPDIFGDARMRQAIASCLDRQKIVDNVLFGLSQVPDSYVPPDDPLHNGNIETYTYNPASGSKILEQIGWLDLDNNPATPRVSQGVTNVPNGTPLVLNYVTSAATQRHQVVEILAQSLAGCGIGLNIHYVNASDLYLPGPAGPLFGRQFDLAEYAIGVNSLEPQCSWFTTAQIPTEKNNWIGTNISGYKNPVFDTACEQALQALPDDPAYTAHQQAQSIFASDLPSIPLYLRLRIAATRPDFCGFKLDPSSNYALADLESFDYGTGCK